MEGPKEEEEKGGRRMTEQAASLDCKIQKKKDVI